MDFSGFEFSHKKKKYPLKQEKSEYFELMEEHIQKRRAR